MYNEAVETYEEQRHQDHHDDLSAAFSLLVDLGKNKYNERRKELIDKFESIDETHLSTYFHLWKYFPNMEQKYITPTDDVEE